MRDGLLSKGKRNHVIYVSVLLSRFVYSLQTNLKYIYKIDMQVFYTDAHMQQFAAHSLLSLFVGAKFEPSPRLIPSTMRSTVCKTHALPSSPANH